MIIPSPNINVFGKNGVGGDPTNEKFFTGSTNADTYPVDPLLTGFAFIKWTKLPSWVKQEFGNFAAMTEKNFRGLDLPGDFELQTLGLQQGFGTEETHFINGVTKNQGFTVTHKEFSGSPIRNAYTGWVTGIRDPRTGIATYPLKYNIEYTAANHTGELLYIMTRPDANNVGKGKVIEFAAYFTNVIPLKAPLSHLNFAAGTQDNPEIQINFTGNMHVSQKVDEFAVSQFQAGKLYKFETEGEYTSAQFGG